MNREAVSSNILVTNNKAEAAERLRDIRESLGVRAADNLLHAELVLLVEGECDRTSLRALLSDRSTVIREALANNTLTIDALSGASKLPIKADLIRYSLCGIHVFLDNDKAGRASRDQAIEQHSVAPRELQLAVCKGMNDSELEDMFDLRVYEDVVKAKFGVNLRTRDFRSNKKKWSDRMHDCFHSQGNIWSDAARDVKTLVAEAVAADPGAALIAEKSGPFDSLLLTLEDRIAAGGA